MKKNTQTNFRELLGLEGALIFLFLGVFFLYVQDILPKNLETEILTIVGIIGLIPVGKSAFASLLAKKINVDLLATVALSFSFISAEWSSLLFINLMLSAARILDIYTKRRVQISLDSLLKLKPSKARVSRDEKITEIPISEILPGDLVVVNLGEQIPVDGVVIEGYATINQASLTGESVPVLREKGGAVLSATIVVSGNVIIRAERVGAETVFERMINLVESSHDAKTRVQTTAERFASWYIGIIFVIAIVLYLSTKDTSLVLAVVLVVCADDIAIAIPLGYIAAIGTAARRGIIIKSADFLEQAARITTLIVDKTGTLTLGKLSVEEVIVFNNATLQKVFSLSGEICARSNHPVSVAIRKYAKSNGVKINPLEEFREIEGRGIYGTSSAHEKIIIGRPEFFSEFEVEISEEIQSAITQRILNGNNVTLLALNNTIIGLFSLSDEMREGIASTINGLRKSGIKEFVMLTGDNEGVAKKIAGKLGLDKYYSELLPENKVHILNDFLNKNNRIVAMVGDGVNDAAVLARADVGIAMGGIGSDAAIESADIILMQDNFEKIAELRTLSERMKGVVRGNFIIWGIVNVIGLYLVFTHVLNPTGAAAYNFLTDFIPIANSLRLFKFGIKPSKKLADNGSMVTLSTLQT